MYNGLHLVRETSREGYALVTSWLGHVAYCRKQVLRAAGFRNILTERTERRIRRNFALQVIYDPNEVAAHYNELLAIAGEGPTYNKVTADTPTLRALLAERLCLATALPPVCDRAKHEQLTRMGVQLEPFDVEQGWKNTTVDLPFSLATLPPNWYLAPGKHSDNGSLSVHIVDDTGNVRFCDSFTNEEVRALIGSSDSYLASRSAA